MKLMKRLVYFLLPATVLFLFSCTVAKKAVQQGTSISRLQFINEYVVPSALQFKGTTVGGLSGIDYDANNNMYYLICDDRSTINPARFYTAKINISEKGIDSVIFSDMVPLLQQNGKTYPSKTADPEAIRYNPFKDELVWTSEGDRVVTTGKIFLQDPAITIISKAGNFKDSFALPDNMRMQLQEKGPRQNGVFEGMTFANNYKDLFVSVEEPLYEDGLRVATGDSTGLVRFLHFDVASKKQLGQYAYRVDPVAYPSDPVGAYKINGIPDILSVGKNQFLVIERSFSTGRASNTIKLFLAEISNASNVAGVMALDKQQGVKPIQKKLLFNMDELGRYIDNVEGVTFGPLLANGHRTLLLVADDNFSKQEKMQFFLFEIIP
jgi:hypothetical protein